MLCSNAEVRTDPRRRRNIVTTDMAYLTSFRAAPFAAAARLRMLQHARDGGGDPLPVRGFLRELLAPGPRQRVELRAPVVLGITPRRLDPALLLETVERGVERSLVHLQHVLGQLLQPLRDAPAVHVAGGKGAENQQVEGALQQVAL